MRETFLELFKGRLFGVMSEEDYDALAASLTGEWIAVDLGAGEVRVVEMTGSEVGDTMRELRDKVKSRNMLNVTFPYTYVHTPRAPRMIKLYDPINCGSGCSTSSPDPWWIFSVVRPERSELDSLNRPGQKEKPNFFRRLLKG